MIWEERWIVHITLKTIFLYISSAWSFPLFQNLPEDVPLSSLGDVILQDQFTIWEPKQLIKKSRERRVFLFDHCLILAKEATNQPGEHKSK